MRDTLFYGACISFFFGITVVSVCDIFTQTFSICVFLVALALFGYSLWLQNYRIFFLLMLMVLIGVVGIVRYAFFISAMGDIVLRSHLGKDIKIEGVIVSEPDERESGVRFVVEVHTLMENHMRVKLLKSTKVIFNDGPYSRSKYGDKITVTGILQKPEGFETESGRLFDYEKYLRKEGIFYTLKQARVSYVSSGHGNATKEKLFAIKRTYIRKTDEVIPFPESRLAAGIVVAGKKSLPESVKQDFQKSGTMQVVVLSGMNVTIIANAFVKLLSAFPKVVSGSFGIMGIILFTIIAGGSATIVRGSIMSILGIVSVLVRREYNINRSIMVAAVCMLMHNPMLLMYDPSFQLSFLATLGLVYASPVLKSYGTWLPEKYGIRETVATTTATQLFVTPYMLYASGDVSFVALPANILVSLIIPPTMLVSFLATCAGFIHWTIALPFSLLAFVLLRYELTVVHFFATLPHAFTTIRTFPVWAMLMSYGCFGVVIWRHRRRETVEVTSMREMNKT